jgi:hypothetical protein
LLHHCAAVQRAASARFVITYVVATSEDPANGAHSAFLDNITDVADDVFNFGGVELNEGKRCVSI